ALWGVLAGAGALGAVARVLEHLARQRVQLAPRDARADRRPGPLQRLAHEAGLPNHLRRRLPANEEGTRHVGPARGGGVLRPAVDLTRQPSGQRARAGLVPEP